MIQGGEHSFLQFLDLWHVTLLLLSANDSNTRWLISTQDLFSWETCPAPRFPMLFHYIDSSVHCSVDPPVYRVSQFVAILGRTFISDETVPISIAFAVNPMQFAESFELLPHSYCYLHIMYLIIMILLTETLDDYFVIIIIIIIYWFYI